MMSNKYELNLKAPSYVPKNKQVIRKAPVRELNVDDETLPIIDRPSFMVGRKFNKFDKVSHKTWKAKFDVKFDQLQNEFERLVKTIEARNTSCDCQVQLNTLAEHQQRLSTGIQNTASLNADVLLKLTSIESMLRQQQQSGSTAGLIEGGDDLSSFDNCLSRSIIKLNKKFESGNKKYEGDPLNCRVVKLTG